jgi:hypothetical protein
MSGPADLDQQLDAYLGIRETVGLTNKAQYRLLRNFGAYAQDAEVTADSLEFFTANISDRNTRGVITYGVAPSALSARAVVPPGLRCDP